MACYPSNVVCNHDLKSIFLGIGSLYRNITKKTSKNLNSCIRIQCIENKNELQVDIGNSKSYNNG